MRTRRSRIHHYAVTSALVFLVYLSTGMARAQDRSPDGTPTVPPNFNSDSCPWSERVGNLFFEQQRFDVLFGQYSSDRLRTVAELWKLDPGYVLVEGHSDRTEAASNTSFDLGMRRSEWVRDQLAAIGVPADRVWLRSWGASQPLTVVAPGDPAERQNRRVEITLSGYGQRCAAQLHQRELRWVQQSCLGSSASANEEVCRAFLGKLISRYQRP